MRDRILRYLQETGRPAPAGEILRSVLNIGSPNAFAAERVLRGIVGDDPRFVAANSLWQARKLSDSAPPSDFGGASFLFLEQAGAAGYGKCLRGAFCARHAESAWEFDISSSSHLPRIRSLRRWISQVGEGLLVAWSGKECHLWNRLLQTWGLEPWQGTTLSLRKVAERTLANTTSRMSLEDLAADLGMVAPDTTQPKRMARFLAACLAALLERVPEEHRRDLVALQAWLDEDRQAPDFSRFAFGREYLRQLPACPGVYIMKNRAGNILYVGKSRNLKRRVGSYFTARGCSDPKVSRILELLHSMEVLPTTSEIEALLLEMRLIRDFRPAVNIQAEIHERPGSYGKEHNLILLVAEPGKDQVQLYFLKEGVFAGQQSGRMARPASSALKRKIRAIYFAGRRRKKSPREPWEMEIVYRWLSVNRRRLNLVDIDNARGWEDTIRQLDAYLCDPDRLLRKVYYR